MDDSGEGRLYQDRWLETRSNAGNRGGWQGGYAMRETSKAMRRRAAESALEEKPVGLSPFFWDRIFQGKGLDIGAGDDPLDIPDCLHFDLPDGAGDDVTQ